MSAESILKQLDRLERGLDQDNIVKKLVSEGAIYAQTQFGSDVPVEISENSYGISGVDGMVAEFGAGLTTDDSHPYAKDMSFPVKEGSYSDANKGEFFKTGHKYWHYNHTTWNHIPPKRGMFLSMEYLKQNCGKFIKEALDNK